ncbi:MAG: type II secretion system protein, partial [Candidatus Sacchiramonaceae bacterium]|nr:type II secretion system protein [Candidatus Saccharimonadaceae bacterium]
KERNRSSRVEGFTIIEVVLVLAIAGLIFLMVFVALPALQRNQRDTQRKNDMARLKTAIESYKANNRGQLPWTYGVQGS